MHWAVKIFWAVSLVVAVVVLLLAIWISLPLGHK